MAAGEEFVIHLRNTRKSLSAVGVHVDHSDGKTLRIDWIRPDGMFGAWNAAHPREQVYMGDRIIGVNGMRNDSQALLGSLAKQELLEVALRRGEGHARQRAAREATAASGGKQSAAGSGGGPGTSTRAVATPPLARPADVRTVEAPEPAKLAGPARPGGHAAAQSLGSGPAPREGDEDGGPRWFRVIYRPHVPARFLVCRPPVPVRCKLSQNELLEVAEVRGGWARLAPAELSRHCLSEDLELWVLMDGAALGFARFLLLAPSPVGYVREGGGVIISEGCDQVHSPWDPGRVVLENDMAWKLMQGRLQR